AAGGDDGADGDRRLVADTARRVLVDDPAPQRRTELNCLAAPDHRVGQRVCLRARETAEVDRHAPGGHLVVGHLVPCVREDQLREVGGGVLLAVALLLDQLRGSDHGAVSATNTQPRRVAVSGPSNAGTRSARCLCPTDDAMYPRTASASRKSTVLS